MGVEFRATHCLNYLFVQEKPLPAFKFVQTRFSPSATQFATTFFRDNGYTLSYDAEYNLKNRERSFDLIFSNEIPIAILILQDDSEAPSNTPVIMRDFCLVNPQVHIDLKLFSGFTECLSKRLGLPINLNDIRC